MYWDLLKKIFEKIDKKTFAKENDDKQVINILKLLNFEKNKKVINLIKQFFKMKNQFSCLKVNMEKN